MIKSKGWYVEALDPDLGRQRPLLVFIPGGPGLSSNTLRSLEILKRSFDLLFVDPPGTGGAGKYSQIATFDQVAQSISDEISRWKRSVVLIGHSFGGLLALEIAAQKILQVVGVVPIATPFLPNAFEHLGAVWEKNQTVELESLGESWDKRQDDESFRKWNTAYRRLYFNENKVDKGAEMLAKDLVSAKLFLDIRGEAVRDPNMLDDIAVQADLKRLLIAGGDDIMVAPFVLATMAQRGRFDFVTVPNAGHFVGFDQPEIVSRVIEDSFGTKEKL